MAPITAEDVVKYLESHPGFFIEHPDLLRGSGLLEETAFSARVLNLRERLFEQIKGERADLIRILDETIEVVRQNEQIENDFIALEGLLFEGTPSAARLGRVAEEIERRFGLEYAGFVLLEPIGGPAPPPEEGAPPRLRLATGEDRGLLPTEGGALLRSNTDDGGGPLFPEALHERINSIAIVPLEADGTRFGHLLLGARNPERYAPGMGTHLLERLALRLALGLALMRRLPPEAAAAPETAAASGEKRAGRAG